MVYGNLTCRAPDNSIKDKQHTYVANRSIILTICWIYHCLSLHLNMSLIGSLSWGLDSPSAGHHEAELATAHYHLVMHADKQHWDVCDYNGCWSGRCGFLLVICSCRVQKMTFPILLSDRSKHRTLWQLFSPSWHVLTRIYSIPGKPLSISSLHVVNHTDRSIFFGLQGSELCHIMRISVRLVVVEKTTSCSSQDATCESAEGRELWRRVMKIWIVQCTQDTSAISNSIPQN